MSSRRPLIALTALLACGPPGCVERRYTIRSNPPGALAIVNGEEIGPTPVSRNFTYYGPREITLIADGYQTQTFIQPVSSPWYDNYLTEFFSENVIPWTIRDEREFTYRLQPATVPPSEELDARAESLRRVGQAPLPPRRRGLLGFFGF
jgi:hypothetical protein